MEGWCYFFGLFAVRLNFLQISKKSLKIPKAYLESVNLIRTDNTMAKRKKCKRTNNDLQNIHVKLKIE